MRFFAFILTMLMGLTAVSALALPVPAPAEAAVAADKKSCDGGAKKSAADKGKNKGKSSSKAGGANDCTNVQKLADGIDKNIKIQEQEQTGVGKVETLIQSKGSKADIDKALADLTKTVNDGIQVRKDNQALAKGNNAAKGLDIVADAQAKELSQVQSLKGTQDDLKTIAELKNEFAGGIEQNKKNIAAAKEGCNK
ncbi:hypothetical protein C8034_v007693 [Colletotrichum sidae]|uniref:Small secreted protein n=1 Tax=Colletotrichum sidae TaxID=1347389 RepID=A0A4R8T3B2_9PEZI|nr:hypothetical protein C8034_v007693 [Colletotrichum sidae]